MPQITQTFFFYGNGASWFVVYRTYRLSHINITKMSHWPTVFIWHLYVPSHFFLSLPCVGTNHTSVCVCVMSVCVMCVYVECVNHLQVCTCVRILNGCINECVCIRLMMICVCVYAYLHINVWLRSMNLCLHVLLHAFVYVCLRIYSFLW